MASTIGRHTFHTRWSKNAIQHLEGCWHQKARVNDNVVDITCYPKTLPYADWLAVPEDDSGGLNIHRGWCCQRYNFRAIAELWSAKFSSSRCYFEKISYMQLINASKVARLLKIRQTRYCQTYRLITARLTSSKYKQSETYKSQHTECLQSEHFVAALWFSDRVWIYNY